MRGLPRLVALFLIAIALPGCTALSRRVSDAVMEDPERLLGFANVALAKGDAELAYRYVGTIHALHSQSPQDREAFPLAVALFRRIYNERRLEYDSIWVTSEPRFMISWLAGRFEEGGAFPHEDVNSLLVGMNGGLFREFESYLPRSPRLARWRVTAKIDNGIVREIDAEPAAAPGA